MQDVAVRIESVLTPEERSKVLGPLLARSGKWAGAHVADVLDEGVNEDWHLDVLEPFWEGRQALARREGAGHAALALVLMGHWEHLTDAEREEEILSLVESVTP